MQADENADHGWLYNSLVWAGDLVGGVLMGGMKATIEMAEVTKPVTNTVAAGGLLLAGETDLASKTFGEGVDSAVNTATAIGNGVANTVSTGGGNIVDGVRRWGDKVGAMLASGDPSQMGEAMFEVGLAVAPMWKGARVLRAGRLRPCDAVTFRDSSYKTRVLQQDVVAYRYSGGVSGVRGRFLTTKQTVDQIGSPEDARRILKLPPGATAETLNALVIPEGTRIYYGRVAGGGGRATQIFIEDPSVLRVVQ